jgi:hypothetical protein
MAMSESNWFLRSPNLIKNTVVYHSQKAFIVVIFSQMKNNSLKLSMIPSFVNRALSFLHGGSLEDKLIPFL